MDAFVLVEAHGPGSESFSPRSGCDVADLVIVIAVTPILPLLNPAVQTGNSSRMHLDNLTGISIT